MTQHEHAFQGCSNDRINLLEVLKPRHIGMDSPAFLHFEPDLDFPEEQPPPVLERDLQKSVHRFLRDHARTIAGKSQLFINAYAKALEVIPRQLCDNSGFDATDVLNKLRQKHALKDGSGKNFGVDVTGGNQLLAMLCTLTPECTSFNSQGPLYA